MKIKVSEASGPALDWMVSAAHGDADIHPYSTNWEDGGPIIEREEICLKRQLPCSIGYDWNAWIWTKQRAKGGSSAGGSGPTPLIAAMRCFCCSKLGDEIDIPEELCQLQNS